ncbi:hypothetical protein D3C78_1696610 [compost metagenome]
MASSERPGEGVGTGVQVDLVPAGRRLLIQFEEGGFVGAGDMPVNRTRLWEAFQAFNALWFILHTAALGIELQFALIGAAGRRFDVTVGGGLL